MDNLDPDSDIYGRHAAGPDRSIGVPSRFFGREIMIPWSAFVYPGAAPATRHTATNGHPAGMYFERRGIVHYEPFTSVAGLNRPWGRLRSLLRMGEKPLKKLTSQK